MKTRVNAILFILLFSLAAGLKISAQAQPAQTASDDKETAVKVYYFHFNTRCATCRAVESEAQLDVQLLFGDDVSFAAYNLDEPKGEAKGKELGVNSQALLIVKGDKKINLTNEGFMYARTNPDKFREIIEAKIKPLL